MKKTYFAPTVEIVKVQTQQMLAMSLGGEEYQQGDPVLAPEIPASVFDI